MFYSAVTDSWLVAVLSSCACPFFLLPLYLPCFGHCDNMESEAVLRGESGGSMLRGGRTAQRGLLDAGALWFSAPLQTSADGNPVSWQVLSSIHRSDLPAVGMLA